MTTTTRRMVLWGAVLLLSACGGGGDESAAPAPTPPVNANPEGIYTGTMTATTAGATWPVFAIVLPDGTSAIFVTQSNFTVRVPIGFAITGVTLSPNVNSFTNNFTAYTQAGLLFTNGQTSVTGTLTGTVNARTSITGTWTSQLDSGSFTLSYAAGDYERAASNALLAGTYGHGYVANNFLVTATTTYLDNGTGTGSDTINCTSALTYTIPDPTRNAYRVATNATCPTGALSFNGLQARFPAGTGAALNGGVNFTTDTLVSVAHNGAQAYMIIASK